MISLVLSACNGTGYVGSNDKEINSNSTKNNLKNTASGQNSSTNTVVPGASNEYIYTLDFANSAIDMYQMNKTTWTVSPLSPESIATGTYPMNITKSSNEKFVYVLNSNFNLNGIPGSLSIYTVESNGGLSPFQTVATGVLPERLVIHPSGQYAYVTNASSGTISIYPIDQSGRFGVPQNIAVGDGIIGPGTIAISPNGQYAYVSYIPYYFFGSYTYYSDRSIEVFKINPSTGMLTHQAYYSGGFNAISMAISHDGQYLYSSYEYYGNGQEQIMSNLYRYKIDSSSGNLTSSQILNAGSYPGGIMLTANDNFVYVYNGSIATFNLNPDGSVGYYDPTSTKYVPNSSVLADQPTGMVLTNSDQYIYSASSQYHNFLVFSVNQSTGVLSQVSSTNVTGSPTGIISIDIASPLPVTDIVESMQQGSTWTNTLLATPVGQFGLQGYTVTNLTGLPIDSIRLNTPFPYQDKSVVEFWLDNPRSSCLDSVTGDSITLQPGDSCSVVIHYEPKFYCECSNYIFNVIANDAMGSVQLSGQITVPYSSRAEDGKSSCCTLDNN